MYEARARSTDPVTSHMAAANVDTDSVAGKVLAALKGADNGLTSFDIAEATGLARVSASPCLAPLERKGYVHRDGTRLQTETGQTVTVWQYGPRWHETIDGPKIDLPDEGEKIEMVPKATFPEDEPSHPQHDPAVAAAWKGTKNKQRAIEVRLFAGMQMVRIEFLDKLGKHVDHVDLTFEEYETVCGFKEHLESLS